MTTAMAVVVGLVAGATRLPRLSSAPPGFLIDEAAAARYAQSINREHLPIFFGGGTSDVQEPFFFYVMKWTGTLFGWDIVGARMAAAVCGGAVAVACALWYRRALGPGWGLVGGVLVATSFWQLMFSRQAIRPISMPIFAALGLWCLWEGLTAGNGKRETGNGERDAGCGLRDVPDPKTPGSVGTRPLPSRFPFPATWWYAASGAAFGAGFYTYISFRLALPTVALICLFLAWRFRYTSSAFPCHPEQREGPHPASLTVLLIVMLLVMAPLGGYYLRHPDNFWERAEQVRDEEGGGEVLDDPFAALRGYVVTLRGFVWDGYDAPNVNQPGRPILDPLLAAWALAGLALALRHPLRPLHGVALIWLALFLLPSALSSPGHPVRSLGATPAVFLFPLLSMQRAVALAARPGRPRQRTLALGGIVAAVVVTVLGSAAWSLHDYFRVWAPSNAAYVAFQGDVRDSLAAIDRLPADDAPVYYATHSLDRLVAYLAPQRARRDFDGRAMLAIPAERGGYLVYPSVTAPDPALLAIVSDGQQPLATGHSPNGAITYQVWIVGQVQRERLPVTAPTLHYLSGHELVGFDVRPAISARDPTPRVVVTVVWRVPAGTGPYAVRVRLVPVDPAAPAGTPPPAEPTMAETSLVPSPATLLGDIDQELLVVRLVLPFPATEQLLADAQVALVGPDGSTLIPPSDAVVTGGYVLLNRVQYRPE